MENVLVVGAGGAGQHVISELQNDKENVNIVGILDADLEKIKTKVLGYEVLDTHKNITKILKNFSVDKVIIAITSIEDKDIELIYSSCSEFGVEVYLLPPLEQLLKQEPFLKQVREVNYVDLLGRKQIEVASQDIKSYIQNEAILVTGAAGSIGSELVRQISKFNPSKIICLDLNENKLYFLIKFIHRYYPGLEVIPEIANIKDVKKINYIFNKHKPKVVFHAAAMKHVPLMENNPDEAIFNNIFGTKSVIDASFSTKVDKFILISTDKAVNPTSVMGATKRVAEIILQNKSKNSHHTKFMAVRFGNVLGSDGSVVPYFQELLRERRNLPVTHKDITRFFMTIHEAAQLVMEAGAIGEGGEVFILDMGKPIKIYDLAKKLIRLSGLRLGKDINIEIVGLRPGEKLYEEILYDPSTCLKTQNKKIFIGQISGNGQDVSVFLRNLMSIANTYDSELIKEELSKIVASYHYFPFKETPLKRLNNSDEV